MIPRASSIPSPRVRPSSVWILAVLLAACADTAPPPPQPEEPGVREDALLTRGLVGDLTADVQVGKRDFAEISPREIVPDKLSAPGGVAVDRSVSPGRAYVWDSGNSRILGLDLATCYARRAAGQRCTADRIFGQASGSDRGACNRDSSFQNYPTRQASSASTLCGMPESTHTTLEDKTFANMAVDAQGTLYVPDMGNHRVLKFTRPFETDVVADEVWGQSGFTGNLCNRSSANIAPTASTLCFRSIVSSGGGVRLDAAGNLWVADGGNNRVLRFPRQTTGIVAKTADLVLGQPNFTTGGDWSGGSELNRMSEPSALVFGPDGTLYVADSGNSRILAFAPPFTSGMAATSTVGTFEPYNGPRTLELDPDGRGLWSTHHENWDTAVRLWAFTGELVQQTPNLSHHSGGAIGFDADKRLLVSTYVYGQDVHRLAPQPDGTWQEDLQLFSPPGGYNQTSGRRLEHPAWVGLTVTQNQLIVADGRLLFWNNPTTVTQGKPADGYVGAASVTELPNPGFGQVKSDASGRVWVTKASEVRAYQAPLATGAQPLRVLTAVAVLGGGQISFDGEGEVQGLAITPDSQFLWVAQPRRHRVLRIRAPLTNAPVVDVVLGQTALSGTTCNQGLVPAPNTGTGELAGLDMLCFPGALSLDRQGNLYVSDHFLEVEGNWRMLMFSADLFPATPNSVLFAPAATKEFPKSGVPGFPHTFQTFEPAFDSTNRMVVGFNPYSGKRFVQYFDDPTSVNPADPRDAAYASPTGQLADFYGWPVGATFDAGDNLYVYDANRGRVMIYLRPFRRYTITGSVAITGGDDFGVNRLTRGPCPGQPFTTAAALGSTIQVSSTSGQANWDCGEPEFFIGSVKGQPLSLTQNTQQFTFTPPKGFACGWYAVYGPRASETFAKQTSGACTLTLTLGSGPGGDLFLWFFVDPVATYDATLKAPRCGAIGKSCDSRTLLNGRATLGPELNAPNTLFGSCPDGTAGTFHAQESLDQLVVSTEDGTHLAPGKTVSVQATVWARAGLGDTLDLYYTADANNPAWTYLTSLAPQASGKQVLSASYVLPQGALQAVRGHYRYGGSPAPCSSGTYDESDDLVFRAQ
jgi:sugar lactone lactonase YvrE